MSEKTDFIPEKSVLSDRFYPVAKASVFTECSYCVFRNMKLFCNKLSPVCTYISSTDDDFYGSVYWNAKKSGDAYGLLGCRPDREFVDFFNKTPVDVIQNTARKMVIDALREKIRK